MAHETLQDSAVSFLCWWAGPALPHRPEPHHLLASTPTFPVSGCSPCLPCSAQRLLFPQLQLTSVLRETSLGCPSYSCLADYFLLHRPGHMLTLHPPVHLQPQEQDSGGQKLSLLFPQHLRSLTVSAQCWAVTVITEPTRVTKVFNFSADINSSHFSHILIVNCFLSVSHFTDSPVTCLGSSL